MRRVRRVRLRGGMYRIYLLAGAGCLPCRGRKRAAGRDPPPLDPTHSPEPPTSQDGSCGCVSVTVAGAELGPCGGSSPFMFWNRSTFRASSPAASRLRKTAYVQR